MAKESADLRKRADELERALDRYAQRVGEYVDRAEKALDDQDIQELFDLDWVVSNDIRKRHDAVVSSYTGMNKLLRRMSQILGRLDKDTDKRLTRLEKRR